jgi:hypothetical protein
MHIQSPLATLAPRTPPARFLHPAGLIDDGRGDVVVGSPWAPHQPAPLSPSLQPFARQQQGGAFAREGQRAGLSPLIKPRQRAKSLAASLPQGGPLLSRPALAGAEGAAGGMTGLGVEGVARCRPRARSLAAGLAQAQEDACPSLLERKSEGRGGPLEKRPSSRRSLDAGLLAAAVCGEDEDEGLVAGSPECNGWGQGSGDDERDDGGEASFLRPAPADPRRSLMVGLKGVVPVAPCSPIGSLA